MRLLLTSHADRAGDPISSCVYLIPRQAMEKHRSKNRQKKFVNSLTSVSLGFSNLCCRADVKGPLKYLLMPLLGKNQFAITLHMCALTGPNLDNRHGELKWISSWFHRTTPKVTWPKTKKCILTEWLDPFFRIFCTIRIQKPFWINLSMRFGLWWKMKKWEGKMCFFDHSFAHTFFVVHFLAKPMLEFLENMTFFRIVFKPSNYNYHSRRKVLFSLHGSGERVFSGLVPKHC